MHTYRNRISILGVTLLEIMLVLAVAAMIIVMSVRYYQSASSSSKVNAALSDTQGIIAAVDTYISAGGSIASVACDKTTCTALGPYIPNGKTSANAWGGATTVTAGTSNDYVITLAGVPTSDCYKVMSQLIRNNKISGTLPSSTGTGSMDCKVTVSP